MSFPHFYVTHFPFADSCGVRSEDEVSTYLHSRVSSIVLFRTGFDFCTPPISSLLCSATGSTYRLSSAVMR